MIVANKTKKKTHNKMALHMKKKFIRNIQTKFCLFKRTRRVKRAGERKVQICVHCIIAHHVMQKQLIRFKEIYCSFNGKNRRMERKRAREKYERKFLKWSSMKSIHLLNSAMGESLTQIELLL